MRMLKARTISILNFSYFAWNRIRPCFLLCLPPTLRRVDPIILLSQIQSREVWKGEKDVPGEECRNAETLKIHQPFLCDAKVTEY
jgi:hypothetical protein